MSLEWPAAPLGGFDQSNLSPSREDLSDGHLENARLVPHIYVAGAMLFNRLKYSESGWIGTRVPIFLKAVFDVLLEIREGLLDPRFPHNLPGKENATTSFDLPRTTTSSVFKKFM